MAAVAVSSALDAAVDVLRSGSVMGVTRAADTRCRSANSAVVVFGIRQGRRRKMAILATAESRGRSGYICRARPNWSRTRALRLDGEAIAVAVRGGTLCRRAVIGRRKPA